MWSHSTKDHHGLVPAVELHVLCVTVTMYGRSVRGPGRGRLKPAELMLWDSAGPSCRAPPLGRRKAAKPAKLDQLLCQRCHPSMADGQQHIVGGSTRRHSGESSLGIAYVRLETKACREDSLHQELMMRFPVKISLLR